MPKTGAKRKLNYTTAEERAKCLLEFEKDQHKKKSLEELAVVAQVLLNRDEPFHKATIKYWKSKKQAILQQSAAYRKRHKNDPRGPVKNPVKKLVSQEEFQFQEELCDHFEKISDWKNLTIAVMIHEGRKFHAKYWPNLKLKQGRPARKCINRRYISNLMKKKN